MVEGFYISCPKCHSKVDLVDGYHNTESIQMNIIGDEVMEISCLNPYCKNTITTINGKDENHSSRPHLPRRTKVAIVGKLKEEDFFIGGGKLLTLNLLRGEIVNIVEYECHHIWGNRYRIEGCNFFLEENCFEWVRSDS